MRIPSKRTKSLSRNALQAGLFICGTGIMFVKHAPFYYAKMFPYGNISSHLS